MNTTITVIIFNVLFSITQAAKILGIFPFAGHSHFTFNNAVMKSLANAGHEIVIITPFAKEAAKENYTSVIDTSDGEFIFIGQSGVEEFASRTTTVLMDYMAKSELPSCEKVLKLREIQDALKSETSIYDVIFVELLNYQHCFYWIGKKLNIPVIGLITYRSWIIGDLDSSGPRHPALIPIEFGRTANYKNFYDRCRNVWNFLKTTGKFYWDRRVKGTLIPIYQKYVKSYLSYEEFMGSIPALVFVNGHFSYFPRPMNPNMIEIGGITMIQNKPLPQDIQLFLDGAKQGAILFTFGSVIRAAKVPKNKIQAIMEAFAEIPQRIIWKYEEELKGISNNVMVMKWVPQSDILAHKNIKAFISHCGQGAIHESIYHGVPLVSCPLFGDQHVNANIFENLEIAVHLDYETITKESVLNVLNEIINNTKYYEKMQKLSISFRDRPMTPQQTVVYWTEYILRHKGASHLISPGSELNWFQYLLLDVILFVIFVIFLLLYILYYILKLCYSVFKLLYCKKNVKLKIK